MRVQKYDVIARARSFSETTESVIDKNPDWNRTTQQIRLFVALEARVPGPADHQNPKNAATEDSPSEEALLKKWLSLGQYALSGPIAVLPQRIAILARKRQSKKRPTTEPDSN